MNEQETAIFNRVTGFAVHKIEASRETREDFDGTVVTAHRHDEELDFFFPDYADMSNEEMAEVVANNLREALWNSLKP